MTKDLFKSHDPMVASELSNVAYSKTKYEPYGHKGHAEAARAHMAAAFYNHHSGNKEAAKDHLEHAKHHCEEADKCMDSEKKSPYVTGPGGSKPSKSMSHKFVEKNLPKLQDLIGGKRTSKSLMKSMVETKESIMSDDIEALFKSEVGGEGEEEKMIEILIGDEDGEDAETRLLSLSEIKKSLRYLKKGKSRKAKTVAKDNHGRITASGDTSSKRSAPGVSKDPKFPAHITKGEGEEESEEGKDKKDEKKVEKSGEEKKGKPPMEVIKGHIGVAILVQNNTETGDEAIAESIKKGLGQGGIPSQRNFAMEGSNSK